MKKKILLPVILILACVCQAIAQYEIPSFNVLVNGKATFCETGRENFNTPSSRARRVMNVNISTRPPTTRFHATIWVYSLDGMNVYGPFTATSNTTIQVEIDDREWGVLVETEDYIIVNVWIDEYLGLLKYYPVKDENMLLARISDTPGLFRLRG